MRIVVHDFGGYDFPTELSRALARRDHSVLHLHCGDILGGVRGALEARPDDPPGLQIESVTIGRPFEKYDLRRRFADELAYGRRLASHVGAFDPRVVLSANTPLLSQRRVLAEAQRHRRRFVYWFQDSYGVGMRELVRRRSPCVAPLAAWPFEAEERRMLRASDHVVAISEGLRTHAVRWGVAPGRLDVVSNWASIECEPPMADNSWKATHALEGRPIVLYAGTLGLKHDPELLVALAAKLARTTAVVVVVSEGPGRQQLERRARELALENLVLLDYQPRHDLDRMLASADVLVAILEPGAGNFSVPSKVFSYLAAGRPVVASIPLDNQACTVIRSANAGICVAPGDDDSFVTAVVDMLADRGHRANLGANARAYAIEHFAIEPIAERFERILAGARNPGHGRGAIATGTATASRIWSHPENRRRRLRALATYGTWQLSERTLRRPRTVRLTPTRKIRCYPHSPVASSVMYYGLPDPMEMRFLLRFLSAGDVFLDVGAHLGLYTVLASSVAGVHVVALEPSTAAFARLQENIELNSIHDQVTAIQQAAGNQVGQARLSMGCDAMNGLSHEFEQSEEVAITTVDHLLGQLNRGEVAAMKVDVEGFELDVLDGARTMINRCHPAIVVEVNDPEKIGAFARHAGYSCVRYDSDRQTLSSASVSSFDGRNALLVSDIDATLRRLQR